MPFILQLRLYKNHALYFNQNGNKFPCLSDALTLLSLLFYVNIHDVLCIYIIPHWLFGWVISGWDAFLFTFSPDKLLYAYINLF